MAGLRNANENCNHTIIGQLSSKLCANNMAEILFFLHASCNMLNPGSRKKRLPVLRANILLFHHHGSFKSEETLWRIFLLPVCLCHWGPFASRLDNRKQPKNSFLPLPQWCQTGRVKLHDTGNLPPLKSISADAKQTVYNDTATWSRDYNKINKGKFTVK